MLGAYATYVVQNLFSATAPGAFDCYLLVGDSGRVPGRGGWSASLLERGVIRFLYGRPLETLLATWGISLVLIQTVRSIFGAQNVAVANPSWLSGGVRDRCSGVVLPYSRIAIIALRGGRARRRLVRCCTQDAPRPARARRHAEPRDGGLPRHRHRARRHAARSGSARASRGWAAARSRSSATSGPSSARATSSTRSWSSCWAASASWPAPWSAALGPRRRQQAARAGWPGAVLGKIIVLVFIILFIQRRPAGHLRAQGPGARRERCA